MSAPGTFTPREMYRAVNRKLARESAAGWPVREDAPTSAEVAPVSAPAVYPLARSQRMAVCERPRNRAAKAGIGALSDTELIALVLQGAGGAHAASVAKAGALMLAGEGLAGIAALQPEKIESLLGNGRAQQIGAVLEISRRILVEQRGESPLLNKAELVAAYMLPVIGALEIEKFWVLCLNRKSRLLRRVEITSGTATCALAHPREVFRAAIRESATAVVCVHNHPSGDPAPSAPDISVTRQLREAAKAVDIELIDHVIVGRSGADPLGCGYFSFRKAGMI